MSIYVIRIDTLLSVCSSHVGHETIIAFDERAAPFQLLEASRVGVAPFTLTKVDYAVAKTSVRIDLQNFLELFLGDVSSGCDWHGC